jgi:stage II sporulation protein D
MIKRDNQCRLPGLKGLRKLSIVLFACFILNLWGHDRAAAEKIRVRVGSMRGETVMRGQELCVLDGLSVNRAKGRKISVAVCGPNLFMLKGSDKPLLGPIQVFSQLGVVGWSSRLFRGTLELSGNTGRDAGVVNVVDLEQYLAGLVNSEISSTWPMEAIKAQVVAARTYALWKKRTSEKSYHLESTTEDQVYRGAAREDAVSVRAVRETRGIVMTCKNELIPAYYHSCCGGRTDSAKDIKDRDVPSTRSTVCKWCTGSPRYRWTYEISAKKTARLLSSWADIGKTVTDMRPLRRTIGGRIVELSIRGDEAAVTLSGEDLRRALGFSNVKSTRFEVSVAHGRARFSGTGFGHGIGACQWGMRGMADAGYTWDRILKHYYKGVELTRK